MTAAASSVDHARGAVVAAARGWIGTPYHHRAALCGVGCDCLGLVRGVWREVFGHDVPGLPAYSGDWGDVEGVEGLLKGFEAHLEPQSLLLLHPGDVIVFRMRPGRIAKHCGIVTAMKGDGAVSFIHAWESTPVAETSLSTWWSKRLVAAFTATREQALHLGGRV